MTSREYDAQCKYDDFDDDKITDRVVSSRWVSPEEQKLHYKNWEVSNSFGDVDSAVRQKWGVLEAKKKEWEVSAKFVDSETFFNKERTMRMYEFNEIEATKIIVNLDHITQIIYTLENRTKELTLGDIYSVFVTLHLMDGNTLTVKAPADLKMLAALAASEGGRIMNQRDLAYYVEKMLTYDTTVTEKKETETK